MELPWGWVSSLWDTAFSAVFHRIHALLAVTSFEFGRTNLTERRMSASLVIEHLDVVEQLQLGLAAAVEAIGRLTLVPEARHASTHRT